MFGSAGRLEKKLREGRGKTAPATVTEAKKGHMAISTGGDAAQQVASAHINWTLKLQVTPDGEATFDAEVKEPYPEMGGGPGIGSTVGVLYDPNDHSKLVIDHGPEGDATTLAAANLSPEAKAALERVSGKSREALQQAMAMRVRQEQSERAKNPGAVATPTAGIAGAQGGAWINGKPMGASKPDPADEIAKLAELRDKGALTDSEFQAQKKKVLGT
jgi:hypothetical protein